MFALVLYFSTSLTRQGNVIFALSVHCVQFNSSFLRSTFSTMTYFDLLCPAHQVYLRKFYHSLKLVLIHFKISKT